jgi:hypothetical protein
MDLLDRIEARVEDTSPLGTDGAASRQHRRGEKTTHGRCDMMPTVAVCAYCSQKIEEKEKSVNVPHLPDGVAHLACAQKVAIRTAPRR